MSEDDLTVVYLWARKEAEEELKRSYKRMEEMKQRILQLEEGVWQLQFIAKNRYYSDDHARRSIAIQARNLLNPENAEVGEEA